MFPPYVQIILLTRALTLFLSLDNNKHDDLQELKTPFITNFFSDVSAQRFEPLDTSSVLSTWRNLLLSSRTLSPANSIVSACSGKTAPRPATDKLYLQKKNNTICGVLRHTSQRLHNFVSTREKEKTQAVYLKGCPDSLTSLRFVCPIKEGPISPRYFFKKLTKVPPP